MSYPLTPVIKITTCYLKIQDIWIMRNYTELSYRNIPENSIRKATGAVQKRAKDMNRQFWKILQMANTHMKKCWISLTVKEIQFKSTMSYHFKPFHEDRVIYVILRRSWCGNSEKPYHSRGKYQNNQSYSEMEKKVMNRHFSKEENK